jgi:hypothetical protein
MCSGILICPFSDLLGGQDSAANFHGGDPDRIPRMQKIFFAAKWSFRDAHISLRRIEFCLSDNRVHL